MRLLVTSLEKMRAMILSRKNKKKVEDLRFEALEKTQHAMNERLSFVERQTGEMVKIALILDQQTQMNEKQNEIMVKINDNLTTLNHTTNRLGERVNDLETEVKASSKRDTLVISDTLKKYAGIGLVVAVTITITWLLSLFGIVGG